MRRNSSLTKECAVRVCLRSICLRYPPSPQISSKAGSLTLDSRPLCRSSILRLTYSSGNRWLALRLRWKWKITMIWPFAPLWLIEFRDCAWPSVTTSLDKSWLMLVSLTTRSWKILPERKKWTSNYMLSSAIGPSRAGRSGLQNVRPTAS